MQRAMILIDVVEIQNLKISKLLEREEMWFLAEENKDSSEESLFYAFIFIITLESSTRFHFWVA